METNDPDLLKKFTKLDYYPVDEKFRFELELTHYQNPETVEMETSTGDIQYYKKIGYLTFQINDQDTNIHVYQNVENPSYYFVPFRDATSGDMTYGAGRYLELEKHGNKFVLDFNFAYNPFCAYSDHYSCPLPPYENWLTVPIEAGEKEFPLATH